MQADMQLGTDVPEADSITRPRRKNLLFWAAGASHEYLWECPETEHIKYQCIGALVFMTSIAAFISMFLALSMTWRPYGNTAEQDVLQWQTTLLVLLALLWAVFIFSLDRFIVSSIRPDDRLPKRAGQAVPRFIIGILIGLIISRPIEIKIFESEIRSDIALRDIITIGVARAAHNKLETDKTDSWTTQYRETKRRLQDARDDMDNQATAEETSIAKLREEIAKLNKEAIDEQAGTGRTGKRGKGPVYDGIIDARDSREQELQGSENRLSDIRRKQQENEADRITNEIAMNEALSRHKEEINVDNERWKVIQRTVETQGFLDLNAGLMRLADTRPLKQQSSNEEAGAGGTSESASATPPPANESQRLREEIDASYRGYSVRWALWAITAFFIIMEITPVLVKVLTPPGPYDLFLRGEVTAVEMQHLRYVETSAKVDEIYREEYLKTYKLAIQKIYEGMQRDFEDVSQGKLAEVFNSHWNALKARLLKILGRLERIGRQEKEKGKKPIHPDGPGNKEGWFDSGVRGVVQQGLLAAVGTACVLLLADIILVDYYGMADPIERIPISASIATAGQALLVFMLNLHNQGPVHVRG